MPDKMLKFPMQVSMKTFIQVEMGFKKWAFFDSKCSYQNKFLFQDIIFFALLCKFLLHIVIILIIWLRLKPAVT